MTADGAALRSFDHVRKHLFIDSRWVEPSSGEVIEAVCASTGEVFGRVPRAVAADVHRAVAAARRAFDDGRWAALPVADRAQHLDRLLDALTPRADRIARLVTMENGQPLHRSVVMQARGPIAVGRANVSWLPCWS